MTEKNTTPRRMLPAGWLVVLALFIPPVVALLVGQLLGGATGTAGPAQEAATAILSAGIGVSALLLGAGFFKLAGMGLRGGRPLYASIGFAVMPWVAFIVLRFIFVQILGFGATNSLRSYVYLLLFEAFAIQIWTFGLLFRAVAEWRGGLTAAISSGIVFGLTATLIFQEAFIATPLSILYSITWGVLYGLIRLRTGSLLGTTLVQSLHSFTAWVVMVPYPVVDPGQLQNLYIGAIVVYAVIIWRLWPREVSDYRV